MLTPGIVGSDLSGFFRADQICTPIATAVTVNLTEPPAAARDRLNEGNFDQAPVMRGRRPVGWVKKDALTRHRTVKSAMMALDDCILVSAESSIASVLPLITEHMFIFVVGAGEVMGFIVHSDLDRQAVRSYLYLLIAGIEMQLAEIVKCSCEDSDIERKIKGPPLSAFHQARSAQQETSPVEYVFLKDLITLFKDHANYGNHALWNESLTDKLEKIEPYRNPVMHANRSLAASANSQTIGSLPTSAAMVADALHRIITSLSAH